MSSSVPPVASIRRAVLIFIISQLAESSGSIKSSVPVREAELGTLLAGLENEIWGRMSFQLQTEQMPGYLAVRFIGSGETGEGLRQFESIAEQCKRTKNDKLLIDTTGFDVRMSVTSGYFAGEKAEIFARHGIKKVAFVGSQEQLRIGKFSILVARNRFINVEAFSDFQAAEEWLME